MLLASPTDRESDRSTRRGFLYDPGELAGATHPLAVEGQDDIAYSDGRLVSWTTSGNRFDDHSVRRLERLTCHVGGFNVAD
jgi:hypothetical protein